MHTEVTMPYSEFRKNVFPKIERAHSGLFSDGLNYGSFGIDSEDSIATHMPGGDTNYSYPDFLPTDLVHLVPGGFWIESGEKKPFAMVKPAQLPTHVDTVGRLAAELKLRPDLHLVGGDGRTDYGENVRTLLEVHPKGIQLSYAVDASTIEPSKWLLDPSEALEVYRNTVKFTAPQLTGSDDPEEGTPFTLLEKDLDIWVRLGVATPTVEHDI